MFSSSSEPSKDPAYGYVIERPVRPSPQHLPTSCQYVRTEHGAPQLITFSISSMYIPISKAIVAQIRLFVLDSFLEFSQDYFCTIISVLL